MSDLEKKDQKPSSIISTEVAEVSSISNSSTESGWFRRHFIDGFKPPEDNEIFADLSPTERARYYLSRAEPKLNRRHLMMIALSGCAGTGLFIGSGASLKVAGPASVLIGFGVLGIALIFTMCSVGEICLRYPTTNVFYEIPARFLHPSIGFGIGWIYAIGFLVSAPLELIACAELTQFWSGDDNPGANANPVAWVALIYGLDVIINLAGSRLYGELESLVGLVKVLGSGGLILFSIINVCGGPPTDHYIGAQNFHNPGPFLHSFKGVVQVIVSCSFAYGGTELTGIAAAETANPLRSIPSSVRQTFWRIMFFFILGIFMVCLMVPADTPELGNSNTGAGSPWVLALEVTGVKALPSIFNAILLFSVFGVSNACIYASSRALTSLALNGANLKWFCYIDRQGRPIVSIAAVLTFTLLAFVCASDKYNDVFNWLYAFAALGYLYVWTCINLCFIRIRSAMKKQKGSLSDIVWKSPVGVIGAGIAAIITIATLGLQFWIYLFPIGSDPDPKIFFQNDLSVPFFIFLVVVHKLWTRKKSVFVSDSNIDIDSGVRDMNIDEMKELMREDKKKARKSFMHFISTYIC